MKKSGLPILCGRADLLRLDIAPAWVRWTLLCILFSFKSVLFPLAGCATIDTGQEEWKDLFDGNTLDGWDIKITGYELNDNFGETFRVENGLMKIRYDQYDLFSNRFGHIFYSEPFSHYRLEVVYRFTGEQLPDGPGWAYRNNGIMFHSQPAGSMERNQDFPVSIEFQLLGGDGENERPNGSVCTPGTHIVMDGEKKMAHCTSSGGPTHHGDQWVTAELVVHGKTMARHILNGEVVMEYEGMQREDGTPLSGGYIALQAESHPTDFRSVRLLNLSGCMDSKAKNFKTYFVDSRPELCAY